VTDSVRFTAVDGTTNNYVDAHILGIVEGRVLIEENSSFVTSIALQDVQTLEVGINGDSSATLIAEPDAWYLRGTATDMP
jgi:hypothetical protein